MSQSSESSSDNTEEEERLAERLFQRRMEQLAAHKKALKLLKQRISSTWKGNDLDMYDMFYQM
jgi:hypothetical protein